MNAGPSRSELAQVLGALAIEMQAQTDSAATLRSIVEAAVSIVPGARWAGISLIEGRHVRSEVPTNPRVAELDQLQTALGEGPSLSSLREHHTVHIEDTAAETRWPAFVRRAAELGVRSVLSFQLFVRSENLGVLNLFADAPGAFNDESLLVGGVLAQHAAVAMVGTAAESHFDATLATCDVIGQAKGILMHRDSLTGLQAFAVLTGASQRTQVKLVDLAGWLVEYHESHLSPQTPSKEWINKPPSMRSTPP
jgi:putative methionine-R-sulfoxide reductase with GAF domain